MMVAMILEATTLTLPLNRRSQNEVRIVGFRFIYTGIRVRDMDESIKFYTEVLGMKVVGARERLEPTKGEAVSLKSPDTEQILELNYYDKDSPFNLPYENGEDLDHLAFDVESLQETVDALKRRGIEITVEPGSIGGSIGWKEAFARDPNGIWIELLQRKK